MFFKGTTKSTRRTAIVLVVFIGVTTLTGLFAGRGDGMQNLKLNKNSSRRHLSVKTRFNQTTHTSGKENLLMSAIIDSLDFDLSTRPNGDGGETFVR